MTRENTSQDATIRESASKAGLPGGSGTGAGDGTGGLREFRGWATVEQFPAQGGEADVYLVSRQGERRILKIFRYGIVPKREVYEKLIATGSVGDSPFVRLFEFAYDEAMQCWFEFEEFIPEGSLADLVGKRAFSEQELISLLDTLRQALSMLHEAGILHLDLKPANVLVRTRSPLTAVLSDFSISSEYDRALSKKLTAFKGTSLYQSPEGVAGVAVPKTDWWALGILLLELFLGRHPLDGLPPQVVMYQITTRGIEIPEGIPARFAQLLKGLLTRDPEKRWGNAEIARWREGKDVRVFYEEIAPQATDSGFQRFERPLPLAGVSCFSLEAFFETAFSDPEAWEEGKGKMMRGELEQWLEANGDAARAGQLRERTSKDGDPDQIFLSTACFFHAGLPLSWLGNLCTDEGLMGDLQIAGTLPKARRQLVEALFTGDIFRTYRKLTGKSLGKIDKLLKLAEEVQASPLKDLPIERRCLLLSTLALNGFAGERAMETVKAAVNQSGEGVTVLGLIREKGFPEFARKTGVWGQEDRGIWDLALKIVDSPWKGERRILETLFLQTEPIQAAIRKDSAFRRFFMRFVERPDQDQAFIRELFEMVRQYSFLEPLVRAVFDFPPDRKFEECLGSLRVCCSVRLKADSLREFVLPPLLERAAGGLFLDSSQQAFARQILENPEVLFKANRRVASWRDIWALGPFLTVGIDEINSIEQLARIKGEVLEITDNSKIIVAAELVIFCYAVTMHFLVSSPRSGIGFVPLALSAGIFLFHVCERFPTFRKLLRFIRMPIGWELSRSDSPMFSSTLNMTGIIFCSLFYLVMVLLEVIF